MSRQQPKDLSRGPAPLPAHRLQSLAGRKYVRLLQDYLKDLRQQYRHPNRILFYDDVVTVYLLAFFNCSLRSLRTIEDASQVPGIRQHLSVQAVCKSTLSDANALFDPAYLQGLITQLRQDLPTLSYSQPELAELLEKVQVFDGSFFLLAGEVAWAFSSTRSNGKPLKTLRLNCQLCLRTGLPSGISISGDEGTSEAAAAMAMLIPGQIYLFDSGVLSCAYLRKILGCESHFLCAMRENRGFAGSCCLLLSDQAKEQGVVSDTLGTLTGGVVTPPDQMLREIVIAYTDRKGKQRTLRLLTDLLDVPAHAIAALYRYRWQIELFFRWLKVSASFEHLVSTSKNGVTLGFYVAVIAALLTALYTQEGVSKYSQSLLGLVAGGQAELEDILPIMANRERQRQRDRKRQAAQRQVRTAAQKSV